MRPTSRPNAEAGFTLLEMLVVLTILAAIAASVAGYGATLPRQHEDGVRELVSTLRLARAEAVRTGTPQTVAFDPETLRYGLNALQESLPTTRLPTTRLPAESQLRIRSIREARLGEHPAIRFFADGSSTGGEITITSGAKVSAFEVRWITGQVRNVD